MSAKNANPPNFCPECGEPTIIERRPEIVEGMAKRGVAMCDQKGCNWSEEEEWDFDLTPPPPPPP